MYMEKYMKPRHRIQIEGDAYGKALPLTRNATAAFRAPSNW